MVLSLHLQMRIIGFVFLPANELPQHVGLSVAPHLLVNPHHMVQELKVSCCPRKK